MEIQKTKNWEGLSSQILRTSYDEQKKAMSVQFKNATWQYTPVSIELWKESLNVPSIGKFVNTKIKPNCEAFKIN